MSGDPRGFRPNIVPNIPNIFSFYKFIRFHVPIHFFANKRWKDNVLIIFMKKLPRKFSINRNRNTYQMEICALFSTPVLTTVGLHADPLWGSVQFVAAGISSSSYHRMQPSHKEGRAFPPGDQLHQCICNDHRNHGKREDTGKNCFYHLWNIWKQ